MYSIAICDDENYVCAELEHMLLSMQKRLNVQLNIEVYYSGEELCKDLRENVHIDIVFLDIELMKLSGIDVGYFIREEMEDQSIQIIYISSKQNYAMQLFKTQPFDFLVKPIKDEALYHVMENVIKVVCRSNRIFEFQNGKEFYRVPFDDILYFQSEGHKIKLIQMDRELEFYDKLKNIIPNVPSQYLIIHKSFLVNHDYVDKYTYTSVLMRNGIELAISRAYQKEVRQKIMYYLRGAQDDNK